MYLRWKKSTTTTKKTKSTDHLNNSKIQRKRQNTNTFCTCGLMDHLNTRQDTFQWCLFWTLAGSISHLIFAILFYKAILRESFDNVDVVFHFQKHTIITSLQQVFQQCQGLVWKSTWQETEHTQRGINKRMKPIKTGRMVDAKVQLHSCMAASFTDTTEFILHIKNVLRDALFL